MPGPGDRRDFPAARDLRLQDGPRAKGVSAVQRQAVIEDVKNPHARISYTAPLNTASTATLTANQPRPRIACLMGARADR